MSLSFVRILSQSKPVPSPKRYTPVGISHPLLWSVQSHPAPGLLMSSPPCSSLLLAPGRPLAAAGPSKCGRPELGGTWCRESCVIGWCGNICHVFFTVYQCLSFESSWIMSCPCVNTQYYHLSRSLLILCERSNLVHTFNKTPSSIIFAHLPKPSS